MKLSVVQRKLYDKFDTAAQDRAVHHKATCTVGCDACCYQLVVMTMPEGVILAESLLKRGVKYMEELLPRLREEALFAEQHSPGLSGQDLIKFWEQKRPCVFLDQHLCSIYQDRPFACRTYYVVTDPKHCGGVAGTDVGIIDMADLHEHQLEFAFVAGGKAPAIAPIASMLLWVLKQIVEPPNALAKAIRAAAHNLKTPDAWLDIIVERGH